MHDKLNDILAAMDMSNSNDVLPLKDVQPKSMLSPPRLSKSRSQSGTPIKTTPGKRRDACHDDESPPKIIKSGGRHDLFTSPRKSMRDPEPLLDENPDRFCMFPIKYPEVWEMYKKAEASFWTGKRRS